VTNVTGQITVPQRGSATPSGGAGAQSKHESGGTTPATGGASQVGLHIGLGAASVGLSLLAGYLKARVDANIAQKQIEALLHVAGQWINAHPDEALKKMMVAPEVTTYAWVSLNSSVITFFEANIGPEPTMSDSAPMIDIASIDYAYQPVDPSIPQNFLSDISGGGRHLTTTRTLIIDIPLVTPSVEDMFEYAKAHNIRLRGLDDYVMYRLKKSLANLEIATSDLELHQGTQKGVWQGLQKDFDKAVLQNRYWQDLVDRIFAAEEKQRAAEEKQRASARAEAAALLRRDIWTVHQVLTSTRTELMAVHGGTSGEVVALNHLSVALQATETTGHNVFQNKTAAERYQLTLDAITASLSVLEGLADENPAMQGVMGSLRAAKFMVVHGLADRWPLMVEEHGQ
jgi:hypothetical protein